MSTSRPTTRPTNRPTNNLIVLASHMSGLIYTASQGVQSVRKFGDHSKAIVSHMIKGSGAELAILDRDYGVTNVSSRVYSVDAFAQIQTMKGDAASFGCVYDALLLPNESILMQTFGVDNNQTAPALGQSFTA
jgi:hypothetical protein